MPSDATRRSFKTKPQIALAQLGAALAAGVARGVVLMDASYGTNSALRAGIGALALTYVAAILPTVKVRAVADPDWRVSAKQLALNLPNHAWRTRSRCATRCSRCRCTVSSVSTPASSKTTGRIGASRRVSLRNSKSRQPGLLSHPARRAIDGARNALGVG
jgi:hypothetical protein